MRTIDGSISNWPEVYAEIFRLVLLSRIDELF